MSAIVMAHLAIRAARPRPNDAAFKDGKQFRVYGCGNTWVDFAYLRVSVDSVKKNVVTMKVKIGTRPVEIMTLIVGEKKRYHGYEIGVFADANTARSWRRYYSNVRLLGQAARSITRRVTTS